MATINPLIAMGVLAPDIGSAVTGGLQNLAAIDQLQQAPLRNRLLEAQVSGQEAQVGAQEAALREDQNLAELGAIRRNVIRTKAALDAGGREGAINTLDSIIGEGPTLQSGRGMVDSQEFMGRLSSPDVSDEQIGQELDIYLNAIDQQLGIGGSARGSAESRFFGELTEGLSEEEQDEARRIKLGLSPRAVGSSAIVIAEDESLTDRVARSKAKIAGKEAGAKERAKLEIQKDIKPDIEAGVIKSKAEAQADVSLQDIQSSLPGLYDVVDNLKELGRVATFTRKGRVFDAVTRELGFSPSEGATSRAKYIATVDNEILPLLRQTFGAAFTEKEGQSLKATLGNPDLSPDEKDAQLDAFIEAKVRQIEGLAKRTGSEVVLPNRMEGLEILRNQNSVDLGDGFSVEFKR